MAFPYVKQPDAMDCGPACLKMVSAFYNKNFSLETIRRRCFITREGVSFLGLSEAADSLGFRTMGVKISFDMISADFPLPCIVHWRQNHFIVIYKIAGNKIRVADPAIGRVKLSKEEFLEGWATTSIDGKPAGLALILEPTQTFIEAPDEKDKYGGFRFLLKYLRLFDKYVYQLLAGLLIGSIIQLFLPLLTQLIIDVGLKNKDPEFIYLILFAQLALVLGRLSVEYVRGWLLLYIGTRVNVAVISGFLQKLMSLPVAFFDTKLTGDILQRIDDNNRIEEFLTSASLNILFSFFNLLIFGIVLAIYNVKILALFIAGTTLYVIWVTLFMKQRANLDYQRFREMSSAGNKIITIINGMQEIKLTRSEATMQADWQKTQASLFRLKSKGLGLIQYQTAGATLINELTNIGITLISATAVLEGKMSLGMMLAVQFIIGQMNVPVSQILGFFRTAQDARISLDRLAEVHRMDNEEPDPGTKVKNLPEKKDIYLNNLTHQYEGPRSPYSLKDIDLCIEGNSTTAIVGASGSGKTTLLKMILGFYRPVKGEILVGDTRLEDISLKVWREKTGAVMQDGYLFPGTIAFNIAPGSSEPDYDKMMKAAETANVRKFIESLPLSYNTKIGADGHGLSEGQKQRILIARVVYKNPEILIFDEATNSLDAGTEKAIVDNLSGFFGGKTVIIVAHRLSTVKNAAKIVVLDNGRIVETGNHQSLTEKKGYYFNLIRNQLELGN